MSKILSLLLLLASTSDAFTVAPIRRPLIGSVMRMSTEGGEPSEPAIADAPSVAVIDDSSLSAMDAEMKRQEDAVTRSDELRSQEVFMKKSTGKHRYVKNALNLRSFVFTDFVTYATDDAVKYLIYG